MRMRAVLVGTLLAVGAGRLQSQSERATASVASDSAWRVYHAGKFGVAGGAFARAAELAPGFGARAEARLMQAQALLEAGNTQQALAIFKQAADSVRIVRAALEARLTDGSLTRFASAVGAQRRASLFWAPATAALDTLGPVADPAIRAMLWAPADGALGDVRVASDSITVIDARIVADVAKVKTIRDERAGHVAEAVQYTKLVLTVADSFAVTDKQIAALGDSLTARDAAIARNLAQYRVTLQQKIAEVRTMAAQNRARVDSIVVASGRGGNASPLIAIEQSTAAGYLATADAAEGALEVGLTNLPIKYQRDSLQKKFERLKASLAAARVTYDSAYRVAVAAEQNLAAEEDKKLNIALAAQLTDERWRDSTLSRETNAGVLVLRARGDSLRVTLTRAAEAADFGGAAASFFASLDADSARAAGAVAVRTGAIVALTDVVTRYPQSSLRARALIELAELLTRKADADYGVAQRSNTSAANATLDHADYAPAMARYDEFLRDFPRDAEADAAAYTLGSIAFLSQKYEDAIRAFEKVMATEGSRYRAEAYFRHGDSRFELATRQSGDARRAMLAQSAQSYDRALALAPVDGDVYYLALYKLGWSYYAQAERQQSDEYRKAVDTFARLVREIDKLPRERQARLALRQEAVDYLAIAITQLGGADEAVRYLAAIPDPTTRLLVLRRVARALRDQGEFNNAVIAYRAAIDEAPTDAGTIDARVELLDLLQSRMVEPVRAQEARIALADAVGPASAWGKANPARAAEAAVARERALRESGSYALTDAKKFARTPQGPPMFLAAAEQFGKYLESFATADSAQRVSLLQAEARFGGGDFFGAGVAYSRTAVQWKGDAALAANARRNAVVAFDSALARAPRDKNVQDSLFAASDRFIAEAPDADARGATIAKGRRAAQSERWDVVAATFESFNARWADDAFSPESRKLVGDARYRQGRYADAQREWLAAQTAATQKGRKALADSIVNIRLNAASQAADSLSKAGRYDQAADSVLTSIAGTIGDPARAADALRNAIEVHLMSDSLARLKSDTAASRAARTSAIASIERLQAAYPAYQHTLTYASLRAKLLSDVGQPAKSVEALQQLVLTQPAWPGRADAMVRIAGLLDSLGRRADAAAAYEKFSATYPNDKRAADAQYNAAVTYREAGDSAAAEKGMASFSARFCALKRPELAARCADRSGSIEFRNAMATWDRYVALKLVIPTRAQLTRAGVDQASAPKLQALRALTAAFGRAIATGAPMWVSAGSYQAALAQWQYGVFLRDVELPAELTDAQKTAAKGGSAQQAQVYFDAANKAWQALVDKAATGNFDNDWVAKARAALKGEGIPPREVAP